MTSPRPERFGAIGVVVRHDTYLVVQRAPHLSAGGHWCFPGGHVEPDETSGEAVERELFEELGMVVRAVERLGSVEVPETAYVLDVWVVSHDAGELRPDDREITDLRWLTPEGIRAIAPAMLSNEGVLKLLGH